MREPIVVAWSGGKDSALALQKILETDNYQITLLTTITEGYQRISMHGVREQLLRHQAQSLDLPIDIVTISPQCSDEEYRRRMESAMRRHWSRGVRSVVFGDIFLQDIRHYREQNLAKTEMKPVFPLWNEDSRELSRRFIEAGFRAVITCIDTQALPPSFSGRLYDSSFLADLPPEVDPCGENGEFHSFVFDGPIFSKPVRFQRGEIVLRDQRFSFCDLTPLEAEA